MKNKTIAVWMTLLVGPLGLHKVYLQQYNWIAKLALIPTLLGLYGVYRIQKNGIDDPLAWFCIPLLGGAFSACALRAVIYGLMDQSKWNAVFNPDSPDTKLGASNWLTVVGMVFALALGSTFLMATLAFGFQHLFEYQMR